MEVLFEIVYECFLEGIKGAIKSRRISKALRLALYSLLCFFLIAVGSLAAVSAYSATGLAGTVICALLTALLVGMWIIGCVKICKKPDRSS